MPRRSRSKGRHGLGIEQLEGVEPHEAGVRERIDAAHERGRGHAGAHQIGAERDRGRARRAGHDHRLLRAGEPEAPAERVGVRERQDGPQRALRDAGRRRSVWAQYQSSPSSIPPPTAPISSAASAPLAPLADPSRRGLRGPRPARSGPRASVATTSRACSMTSAGISAAMRERKPSVSMTRDRLDRAGAGGEPGQKLLTPAPYGLTTPSPLTTTSRQPPRAPGRLMPRSLLSGRRLGRSIVVGFSLEGRRLLGRAPPSRLRRPASQALCGPRGGVETSAPAGLGWQRATALPTT